MIRGVDLGISGRACVVTGASRGIGLAAARALAAAGASVLLGARAGPEELPRGGEGLGPAVPAEHAAGRIVEEGTPRFGRLAVLVNTAGTSRNRSLEELTDDEWQ